MGWDGGGEEEALNGLKKKYFTILKKLNDMNFVFSRFYWISRKVKFKS